MTANPLDNDATILLIFGKPAIEEYVIRNRTKLDLCFAKWDQSSNKLLSEKIYLEPGGKQAFTWDYRDIPTKNIQVRLLGQQCIVSIDTCSEFVKTKNGTNTNKMIENILCRDGK